MLKPVIFTIAAVWDADASVWSGHCDDIPAAADAATLDELLAKITAMALDLLPDNHPDNHPDVAPEQVFLQITALREAEPEELSGASLRSKQGGNGDPSAFKRLCKPAQIDIDAP
jgi:hypothetical protein